jgi:cysteine synthase
MTNKLYQIESPDASEYWIKMIKCQDACPVHTDACGYVTAIAEGRDEDAYRMARRLTRELGLLVGQSCGAAMAAALRVAESAAPGSVLVTVFADSGEKYMSTPLWRLEGEN